MSLDPAFYELRTKPLRTLPQRRRLIRERLAKERAELGSLRMRGAAPHVIIKKCAGIRLLTKARDYLGEPHPRLDLYRLFGMELPSTEPKQLPLPLPLPRPKG
jgi:hypothetical protein